MALLCQAGGLGAVAAPWFVFLGQTTGASFVPFIVFGSLSITAGIAMPALPETLGLPAAGNVQVAISKMRVLLLVVCCNIEVLSLHSLLAGMRVCVGVLQAAALHC